jgi:hypothetical protein
MRTATLLAFVSLVAVAGIGLGLGAVTGGAPGAALPWETAAPEGPQINQTELRGFETTGPTCSDPLTGNESVLARPLGDGQRLSLEDNVTVSERGTELTAHFEKIGPRRYQVALKRHPGGESADCHLEIRYNATMNVSTPDSYTIVVTVDGELETVLWSTPRASGGSDRGTTNSDPDPGDDNGSNDTGDGAENRKGTRNREPVATARSL